MSQKLRELLGLGNVRLSLFEKVWLFAPCATWFSYQPLLRFGQDKSMYFELSVALIYVVALALTGLPSIWRARKNLTRHKMVLLASAFVAICGVSLLWTPAFTRGLLTLGLIGLLYFILLASIALSRSIKMLTPALCRLLIVSALIMSMLSLLQLIAGIWLGRDVTQLCAGCTASQFGFARPNVFTIEPQFFGNMLLAPVLILAHVLLGKKPHRYAAVSFFIIVTALFLTLSRGAIFAFIAGLILLFVLELRSLRKFMKSLALLLVSFLFCLLVQGTAAAANPNLNVTFGGAVSASINQLSLGTIDLSIDEHGAINGAEPAKKTVKKPAASSEARPNYDGYAEISTTTRLKLSGLAIKTWAHSPDRIVFGVGLGGSGSALKTQFPNEINNREIVQNEFVEILLENGLIGLMLFAAIIARLLFELRHAKWSWAILLAFLVQWCFFSGYPNALHVYLTCFILGVVLSRPATQAEDRRHKPLKQV